MFRIKILEDAVVFVFVKIKDSVGDMGVPGKFCFGKNSGCSRSSGSPR